MSKKFTGLCVGGPWDKQWYECEWAVFELPVLPARAGFVVEAKPPCRPETMETHRYTYIMGMWVSQELHPDEAMNRLCNAYAVMA